ncbi:hypothetical protein DL762_002563 [Monosporascus cannonballus]|uniref:Uncharacterized protein n=1 Tax=Monosporascus cannonballus TaxID=155416 RepID=A0ABY0HHL9_9PEZI|nr:hypothetical protein DL762_002563 [Monosporascus cannonballus]
MIGHLDSAVRDNRAVAMAEDPRAKYGLSCPSGGSFYICGASDTRFIGCCEEDPCNDDREGSCPESSLRPASFSSTNYLDIPAQSCVEPYNNNAWWTCQQAKPPFMGCCLSNPCNEGCSDDDLLPARLSDNKSEAAPFITSASTTSSSSITTQSPDSNVSETTALEQKSQTELIVGVTMAGLVVLFAIFAAYIWRKRRREKEQESPGEDSVQRQLQPPGGGDQPVMMRGWWDPYKDFVDSFPSTADSSPFPDHASTIMMSTPTSVSTSWSPMSSRDNYSRHTTQLSELSGEDWLRELPGGTGLQPVAEHDSASGPFGNVRQTGSGIGEVRHASRPEYNDVRRYHELEASGP